MVICPKTARMRRGQNIGCEEIARHMTRPLCARECFVWTLQSGVWDGGERGRIQSIFPSTHHVEQLIQRVRQVGHAYWTGKSQICVDLIQLQAKMGTHPDTWFRACGVILSEPINMTLSACARVANISFRETQDIAIIWASIIASLTGCEVKVGGANCEVKEVCTRMTRREAPCAFLADRVRASQDLVTCAKENSACFSEFKGLLLGEIRNLLEPTVSELSREWEDSDKWVGAYVHSFAHFPYAHDISVMRGRMRGGRRNLQNACRLRGASHHDRLVDHDHDNDDDGGNDHGNECVCVCVRALSGVCFCAVRKVP